MTYLQDRNLIGLFLQDSYSPPRGFLQIPTDGIIVHYYQLKDKAIAGLEDDNYRLSQEVDDLEQYTRRTNVRIYGVAEQPEENTDNLAMGFFKSELNVDVASYDISRSHRVGKKSGAKPRPIIVLFTKHNTKVAVMSRRRVLKER